MQKLRGGQTLGDHVNVEPVDLDVTGERDGSTVGFPREGQVILILFSLGQIMLLHW